MRNYYICILSNASARLNTSQIRWSVSGKALAERFVELTTLGLKASNMALNEIKVNNANVLNLDTNLSPLFTKEDTYSILDTTIDKYNIDGCTSHIYNISGHDGDTLSITDTRFSSYEGFFAICDAQYRNLFSYSNSNLQSITNFEHIIETNAAFLIINADSNISPSVVLKEYKSTSEIVTAINEIEEQEDEILIEKQKYVGYMSTSNGIGNQVRVLEYGNSDCYVYDVSKINGYEIKIFTNSQLFYTVAYFADERGYYVDKLPSPSLVYNTGLFKVTVPNGAKTVYVNCCPKGESGYTTVTLRYNTKLLFDAAMFVLNNFALKNLSGMKCITFGDSITWYDGNPYNWGKEEGIIAMGYQSYMRNMGLEVINKGRSGATLEDILTADIKTTDYTGIDIVTITSGANDARYLVEKGIINPNGGPYDTTTFIGALQDAIEYILGQNNKIQIILITPINGWIYAPDGYGVAGQTEDSMISDKYANAMIEVGAYYSIPVCDWYRNIPVNIFTRPWIINDPEPNKSLGDNNPNNLYSLHPSTLGYRLMTKMLVSKINEYITRIN